MGFPPPNEEEAYSFPAARKPDSGDASPAPWESPPSLPLQPDHYGLNSGEPPTNLQYNPNMTGPDFDRPSQEWSSPFGDLSGPYGEPVPGAPLFPPPPPVTGVRLGKDDSKRRGRRIFAASLALLLVLLVPVGVFEYLNHSPSSPSISAADKTATVAIKLDPPTPTLAPGQTPLPTPPATPTPDASGAAPQYATSATVSITRKTQNISSGAFGGISSSYGVSTSGGDKAHKTVAFSETVSGSDGSVSAHLNNPTPPPAVTLTVTNNNSAPAFLTNNVAYGTDAHGKQISCTFSPPTSQIAAGDQVQISCTEPAGSQTSVNYSYTDAQGFFYFGNAPAGGTNQYYSVPANCGTATQTVTNNAVNAVKNKLNGDVSGAGASTYTGPTGTADTSSLTCSPGAGTNLGRYEHIYPDAQRKWKHCRMVSWRCEEQCKRADQQRETSR